MTYTQLENNLLFIANNLLFIKINVISLHSQSNEIVYYKVLKLKNLASC